MKNIFDKTNTENSTLHRPGKLYADLVALLMLVLLIISLIPLLHLGLYNHPTGDDYYYGVEAMHTWQNTHNPFLVIIEAAKGVAEQYRIWQGTYSALFLMYLPPNIWGPNAYHLVTPLILTLLVSGIFFLAHELLCRLCHSTGGEWLAVSSVLSLLCIQTVPFAPESYFWYNGSIYYTGYFAVSLIYFGVLCRIIRENRPSMSILACLLAFFLAGGNYVSLLPTMILSFFLVLESFLRHRKKSLLLFPPFFFLCIGFLISALAPGNRVRQDGMWKIPAIKAVLKSLRQGLFFLRGWTGPWLLIALLVLTPVFWNLYSRTKLSFRLPAIVIGFFYGIMCSFTCPTFYTMNSTGPARAAALMYYAYLFFIIFAWFYLLGYLYRRELPFLTKLLSDQLPHWSAALLVLILLGIFLGTPSSFNGIRALKCLQSGDAAAYEAQYRDRLLILSDTNVTDVIFLPYQNQADLLYVGDLSSDPNDPTNKRVAEYFGKHSVIVSAHPGSN